VALERMLEISGTVPMTQMPTGGLVA
jgi:hypothetical protein